MGGSWRLVLWVVPLRSGKPIKYWTSKPSDVDYMQSEKELR
jgi:hypothetical protein